MNHLFNTCNWACHLWNQVENIMQQTDRTRDSIQDSIMNQRSIFSSNSSVNNIWRTLPAFITWTIWKERNRRIFLSEHENINHSLDTITQNVRQLILVRCKAEQDNQVSVRDLRILKAFKLENGRSMVTTNCQQEPNTTSIFQKRPPSGFLKLNFDGASRGNPALAGIGGIIRVRFNTSTTQPQEKEQTMRWSLLPWSKVSGFSEMHKLVQRWLRETHSWQ